MLVLTVDGTDSPFSTAFRASSPAPSMTIGLEVLVQLVMAAMATEPWVSEPGLPPTWASIGWCPLWPLVSGNWAGYAARIDAPTLARLTRSWGRRGPARLGSTVDRSSSS